MLALEDGFWQEIKLCALKVWSIMISESEEEKEGKEGRKEAIFRSRNGVGGTHSEAEKFTG